MLFVQRTDGLSLWSKMLFPSIHHTAKCQHPLYITLHISFSLYPSLLISSVLYIHSTPVPSLYLYSDWKTPSHRTVLDSSTQNTARILYTEHCLPPPYVPVHPTSSSICTAHCLSFLEQPTTRIFSEQQLPVASSGQDIPASFLCTAHCYSSLYSSLFTFSAQPAASSSSLFVSHM